MPTTTRVPSRLARLGAFALTMVLVATGCERGPITGPGGDDVALTTADQGLLRLRYTGRDSFGVDFKTRISATAVVEDAGRCQPRTTVVITGTGRATHLGRVTVKQSHCYDQDYREITDGMFAYTGTTGDQVTGTYENVPDTDGSPRVLARITGTTLPLTGGGPSRIWGSGWFRGLPSDDTSFSYTLDAYLSFK